MNKTKDDRQQILIYGAESLGYGTPSKSIDSSQYILEFRTLDTNEDL